MSERDGIWLGGSGRSGTTWLGGLLSGIGRSALVFEPLHPIRTRLPSDLDPPVIKRLDRPYIRPGQDAPEWEMYVRALLAGKGLNAWMRYAVRRKHLWPRIWLSFMRAERYVIKEVRGNLIEGWIRERVGVPVVHVIRHPCATVFSQQKAGWGYDLETFLNSPALVDDHLGPHIEFLSTGLGNPTRQQAARWAIDNLVPLRQAHALGILVVTYEELVLDPLRGVKRIAEYAGWRLTSSDLGRIEARSQEAVSGLREVGSTDAMLGKWRKQATAGDIADVLDVVHRLGIEMYDENPLPKTMA